MQLGHWPMAAAQGPLPESGWSAPCVPMLDEAAAADEDALPHAWRRWLQVSSTRETWPGMLLVTASGLAANDYGALVAKSAGVGNVALLDHQAALQQA